MISTQEPFDSLRVFFEEYIKPEGAHQGFIDTKDGYTLEEYGYPVKSSVPTQIVILDGYIQRGSKKMYNILLDGRPCVMTDPVDSRRVTIYDRPHYSFKKED